MSEWLRLRYPKAQKANETPNGFTLTQDGAFHSLQREGTSVKFIVGLPEAEGRKLKGL
jgi:hypothetical protein